MTPEQRQVECLDILEDLEENHLADSLELYRARLKVALLATEKQRHDFHSAMTFIWRQVAQKCGLDPKKFYDDKYKGHE